MSADEPGYVPPDHKTTAEFRIPDRSPAGPPAGDAAEAEATLVDRPLPDDRDDPEETATDPVRRTAAPAATVTDLTMDDPEDLPADDLPQDLPVDGPEEAPGDRGAAAGQDAGPGEWTKQFGQEDEDRRRAPTAPHPGLAAASASPLAAAAVPPGARPAGPGVPQESPQPAVPGPTPPAEQAGAQPLPPPGAPQGGPAPDVPFPTPGAPTGPVPPPGQPVASPVPAVPPPAGRERRGSRTVLVVAAAVVLVAGVIGGAMALALMPDDGGSEGTAAGPGASVSAAPVPPGGSGVPTPGPSGPGAPPGGTPAPSGPPQDVGQPPGQHAPSPAPPPRAPIGPVVEGKGLTYQLVQRDPGYYEGLLIITNRGDRPMKEWTLTFRAPGANVKHVWGGELVRGGDRVTIRNLDGAPVIQPGATWEVRFGAEGAPATPGDCRLNDRGCGFG